VAKDEIYSMSLFVNRLRNGKVSSLEITAYVSAIAILAIAMLGIFAGPASAVQSPVGCTADNSVVNIASDVGAAEVGETITFTVEAGNPASGNGCDIEGRTLTLTLPDGTPVISGPANYPNPTATAIIMSEPYIANASHLVGGVWIASVSWNGTLKGVSDQPSTGSKNASVNEIEDLEVSKTAVPASRISYEWTIDKSVDPATWDLFSGDSGTSEYTITLDKSVGIESHTVSGVITIHNPNDAEDATIESVDDVISGVGDADNLICDQALPFVLGPGQTLECDYSSTLPNDDNRTNTATVTTSGLIDGGEGQTAIDFTNVVPTEVNGTVSVDDTFAAGDFGPVSISTVHTYPRTFACGDGEGEFEGVGNVVDNTATIVETDQSDDASVTVNCYELEVTKDADTTFDRTYEWEVTKTADETEITLAEGESYDIDYTVTANVTGSTDSNWAVSGTITINNPAPIPATINSVSDVVSNVGAMTVVCPGDPAPYVIPADDSLVCTYSGVLPDGDSETNTATATQQNYDYDELLVATPDGTTNYSGNANVIFGAPTNVIDDEVEVTDSYPVPGTVLGTATVGESPKDFNYTRTVMFEGEEACGDHNVDNTATITTNDTDTVDTADETVLVHVNCQIGCTLTQGYWKTHNDSFKGGAPTDDNWEALPGGDAEETVFYLSGHTWFEVFWTAPKGNAYYNLAHQFMAAVLNVQNGASTTPAVDSALTSADNFFETYTPTTFNNLGKKSQVRKDVLNWAGTLGSFNEGLIGPGHCDEQIPE